MRYLISACLAGINCRYNGESPLNTDFAGLVDSGKAVPFCPEVLGGLPVPRSRCELVNNSTDGISVKGEDGNDYTEAFIKGAEISLRLAIENNITTAIMKSRSPSCGRGRVYDGTFTGRLIDGNGITAELFINNGISVLTEDEALEIIDKIKEGS